MSTTATTTSLSTSSPTRGIKITYWVSTALISLMMGFSAFSYFTNPEVVAGFTHLGFPGYFRVELGIAKALGVLALILPMVPARAKEWAYAGFAITFVSAFIAHTASGDPISAKVGPVVALVLLLISNLSFQRVRGSRG